MIHLDELWWPHCDVTGMMAKNGNHPQMAPNDHISAILKVSKLLWLWFSQMIPFVAYFWWNHLRPEDNCWFIRSIQFSKKSTINPISSFHGISHPSLTFFFGLGLNHQPVMCHHWSLMSKSPLETTFWRSHHGSHALMLLIQWVS